MEHTDRLDCVGKVQSFAKFEAQGTFSIHHVLTKYMMQGRP